MWELDLIQIQGVCRMKLNRTTLSIGELANLAECRVDTIRYYERIGLMPQPQRTQGKQRRYSEQQARQLLFIRRLRDLGFSVEEANGFLAMRRQESHGCADFKRIADGRVAQIRQQIGKLRRLERRLRAVSAHCAEGADTNCGVIEALWGADVLDLDLAPRGSVCCTPSRREPPQTESCSPGAAGDGPESRASYPILDFNP
jgi:MerR family transcriptional regulator, mercuric resistance operon regulatory protein